MNFISLIGYGVLTSKTTDITKEHYMNRVEFGFPGSLIKEKLTDREMKAMLALFAIRGQEEKEFYCSNSQISKTLGGKSITTLSTTLGKLEKRGFIEKDRIAYDGECRNLIWINYGSTMKRQKTRKERRQERAKKKGFYNSREWQILRVDVLEKYKTKCMMCGRSPKNHGVVIHVDHIKPTSTHPHLKLVLDNLQLLCEDCNLGKSNRYQTDWRPSTTLLTDEEMAEIEMVQAASEYI